MSKFLKDTTNFAEQERRALELLRKHEERMLSWAKATGSKIVTLDYDYFEIHATEEALKTMPRLGDE